MSYGMASPTGGMGRSSGPIGHAGSQKIGKGQKLNSYSNWTPEQMDLLLQRISELGPESFLAKLAGGDQSAFEEIEAPALRQFGAEQGNIASRFSGMGLGARRSSGFGNEMNAAASRLSQDLASKRTQMRMDAMRELQSQSNALLGQRPYESYMSQKPASFWDQILGGLGSAIGSLPGAAANYYYGR